MSFYLIGPLVTLIPLGSISSWAFKPYCDDGLLGISPTVHGKCVLNDVKSTVFSFFPFCMAGFSWLLLDRLGDDPVVLPSPRRKGIRKQARNFIAPYRIMEQMEVI